MAPEVISEHLISKISWGVSPQTPLVLCACLFMHTYTSDIDVTPLQKILATGLVSHLLLHRLCDSSTSQNKLRSYSYLCTTSTLNTNISLWKTHAVETWLCLCLNSCFYSYVLLILHLPALIFSHFQMINRILSCYGLSVKTQQQRVFIQLMHTST